ncbi:Glyoxalase/Bleomycin resistance protein/Dihydroxybiphenyl dioxygenase [Amniculicola lignicola CBS 123094]|uniref:Glyoxalase/Bleomycin resistance protein/Dihydroxybiphenyl dioxygenase n=1 Tax=Amniculicola lignicola CBS 123094 TaxID=1392246 RepID=A0A6A5WJ52_9PLEO|nr:Glyoxalase/Bleomycin resistance protein/Dihydroxybiphenyl dioxygenase [Amniculicola lignicola CBS 123094]
MPGPHSPQIFINLPSTSLPLSTPFYHALGFTTNATFSGPSTACFTLSPSISVMLHTHAQFRDFMPGGKTLVDGRSGSEALLCFTVATREDVDRVVEEAGMRGGRKDPTQLPKAEGWYGRSVEDPDGHVWEVGWMGGRGEGCGEREKEGEQKEEREKE